MAHYQRKRALTEGAGEALAEQIGAEMGLFVAAGRTSGGKSNDDMREESDASDVSSELSDEPDDGAGSDFAKQIAEKCRLSNRMTADSYWCVHIY